ncbi:hypothetical protein SCA6_015241 [Theobroma cacao]
MASPEEAQLDLFLQWLQANGAQFRGCQIKYCDSNKGFGIYSSDNTHEDGVILVVPLDLAITPMRVLQDPLIGAECRAMFEEGEVDDRFLMILFLTVERLRKNSSWKPYLDMLPTTFGNPLWFMDDELLELRGTALYRATELRKKDLLTVYEDKVKDLVKKLLVLDGDSERANSIFWSRALNLPLPHSYVFPQIQEDQEKEISCSVDKSSEVSTSNIYSGSPINENDGKRFEAHGNDTGMPGVTSTSRQGETVWVEGLLPGIDFCNHDLKAVATWEVDGTGSITENSNQWWHYFLCSKWKALQSPSLVEKEISISYGNKGNEELLYLYGFVIDNNPDDYLMIHYPGEALQNISFSDFKGQLLVAQNAAMRCLLPKILLDSGFFPAGSSNNKSKNTCEADIICNFSWSGHRRTPYYLNKLVFPEDFMTALRTIAMQEDEVSKVSLMLEEVQFLVCYIILILQSIAVTLVGSEGERQPSETEIRTAVWEACGDSGALQLLVDLLQKKMMDLEASSGTEDCDAALLENALIIGSPEQQTSAETNDIAQHKLMSRNRWSSIVYRRGQKQLTRLFLKEAEHALQLSLSEGH